MQLCTKETININCFYYFLPGLKEIHRLTSQGLTVLKIMLKFSSGNTEYIAQYSSFSVAGPETDYQLTLGGYSGNAGRGFDSLSLLFISLLDIFLYAGAIRTLRSPQSYEGILLYTGVSLTRILFKLPFNSFMLTTIILYSLSRKEPG